MSMVSVRTDAPARGRSDRPARSAHDDHLQGACPRSGPPTSVSAQRTEERGGSPLSKSAAEVSSRGGSPLSESAAEVFAGAFAGCAACGGELSLEFVEFARCLACGSSTYVPRGELAEVRVARFWARAVKKGNPPSLFRGARAFARARRRARIRRIGRPDRSRGLVRRMYVRRTPRSGRVVWPR